MRSYCVREERQGPLRLRSADCAREPPQIFSCLENLGIPDLPPTSPLPNPPFGRSCALHEKRPALPGRSKELHKREKTETQTFQDHASKNNDNRRGQAVEHRPLPQFPPFRLNYRNETALLRRTRLVGALRKLHLQRDRKSKNLSPRTSINHNDMNTDIDFMNIAEGDKALSVSLRILSTAG